MFMYLIVALLLALGGFLMLFLKQVRANFSWTGYLVSVLVAFLFFGPAQYFFNLWNLWKPVADRVTGKAIMGVPIEELIYQVCFLFMATMVHEWARDFFRRDQFRPFSRIVSWMLLILLVLLLWLESDKVITALLAALSIYMLLMHMTVFRTGKIGRTYLTILLMALVLVPFRWLLYKNYLFVYDHRELTGLGIGNLPLEDLILHFLMMLIALPVYERFRSRVNTEASIEETEVPSETES